MPHLSFQSVLATGSRELGDGMGPGGAGVFDLFLEDIDLPGYVEGQALVVLATRHVVLDRNFITINPTAEVSSQDYESARSSPHFVWRILPNPSDTWILQIHPIPEGRLLPAKNVLGFHTRNEEGVPARTRDNFAIARIFIVYNAGSDQTNLSISL